MSCILYKDGEEFRVKAEFVEYMVKRGYSSSKSKPVKKRAKPVKKEEVQEDFALADITKKESQG